LFTEKYHVSDPNGQPIIYIERPAMVRAGCLAATVLLGGLVLSIAAGLGAMVGLGGAVGLVVGAIAGIGGFALTCYLYYKLIPRRHITFFSDERKKNPLMRAFQDQKVVFINAWYTLADSEGEILCRFRKNHLYNIFRKRWYVYDPDKKLMFIVKEDSLIISMLRRVFGVFDDLLSMIFGGLFRTNFIFLSVGDQRLLGVFNRKFTISDRYVLDFTKDRDLEIDRRIGVAIGVLLDTGEKR
ncbi:MAG: hypothetical protein K8T89_16140, partial [Planctomycetes bacterium]|nr:hypothetical protein [Planctomycetota bacterium]